MLCACAGSGGKYYQNGQESKSSEESLDEKKQKIVWKLSGGYTHLEGFEPLTATPPSPAEPVVVNGEVEDKDSSTKDQEPTAEITGARFNGYTDSKRKGLFPLQLRCASLR